MRKILIIGLLINITVSCSKKEKTDTNTQQASQITTSYIKTDFYFKLPDYKGGEIDLENYKGKPVLVKFFTETCPHCRKAAPFIEEMHKKYSDKGLIVIGISVKDTKESAQLFAKENNLTFMMAYNGRKIARNYGISGVPFIYLLDKSHNLSKVWAGYDEQYNSNIDESIAKVI